MVVYIEFALRTAKPFYAVLLYSEVCQVIKYTTPYKFIISRSKFTMPTFPFTKQVSTCKRFTRTYDSNTALKLIF
ncbi:MAG: hypothetical protein ACI84K_001104 [Pseudohongiellaceae bacterium]|jgi:hypothetical protein